MRCNFFARSLVTFLRQKFVISRARRSDGRASRNSNGQRCFRRIYLMDSPLRLRFSLLLLGVLPLSILIFLRLLPFPFYPLTHPLPLTMAWDNISWTLAFMSRLPSSATASSSPCTVSSPASCFFSSSPSVFFFTRSINLFLWTIACVVSPLLSFSPFSFFVFSLYMSEKFHPGALTPRCRRRDVPPCAAVSTLSHSSSVSLLLFLLLVTAAAPETASASRHRTRSLPTIRLFADFSSVAPSSSPAAAAVATRPAAAALPAAASPPGAALLPAAPSVLPPAPLHAAAPLLDICAPLAAAAASAAPSRATLLSVGGGQAGLTPLRSFLGAPASPALSLHCASAAGAAYSLNFSVASRPSPSSSRSSLLPSLSLSSFAFLPSTFLRTSPRPLRVSSPCGSLGWRQQRRVSLLDPEQGELPLVSTTFSSSNSTQRSTAPATSVAHHFPSTFSLLGSASVVARPAGPSPAAFSAAVSSSRHIPSAAVGPAPRRGGIASVDFPTPAREALLSSFRSPVAAAGAGEWVAAAAAAERAASASDIAADATAATSKTPAAAAQPPVAEGAQPPVSGDAEATEETGGGIELLLAKPRGFCAGVSRAIGIVEEALRIWGPPVYVRHSIVHNEVVCEDLRRKGAIFVEELEEIPRGSVAVFSAHGVSPAVRAAAAARELRVVDATCPLVSKVHVYVKQQAAAGYHIILIGHRNHVEVEGTRGEAPAAAVTIVETVEDVEQLTFPAATKLYYVTQTTLSLDDCAAVRDALLRRFPTIKTIPSGSICYATTNRQEALRALVPGSDLVLVVGSATSSNAQRLLEVATRRGLRAYLINDAAEVKPDWLQGVRRISLSSSASTPEATTAAVIKRLQECGIRNIREIEAVHEREPFWKFPLNLRDAAKEAAARAAQKEEEEEATAAAAGKRETE